MAPLVHGWPLALARSWITLNASPPPRVGEMLPTVPPCHDDCDRLYEYARPPTSGKNWPLSVYFGLKGGALSSSRPVAARPAVGAHDGRVTPPGTVTRGPVTDGPVVLVPPPPLGPVLPAPPAAPGATAPPASVDSVVFAPGSTPVPASTLLLLA